MMSWGRGQICRNWETGTSCKVNSLLRASMRWRCTLSRSMRLKVYTHLISLQSKLYRHMHGGTYCHVRLHIEEQKFRTNHTYFCVKVKICKAQEHINTVAFFFGPPHYIHFHPYLSILIQSVHNIKIFINWNTFSSILFMFNLFHLFPFILFTLYIFINSFVLRAGGSDVRSVITDSTSAIYQFRFSVCKGMVKCWFVPDEYWIKRWGNKFTGVR